MERDHVRCKLGEWLTKRFKKRHKKVEANGTVPNAIGILQWGGLSKGESARALQVLRQNADQLETTVRIKMIQRSKDDPLYFVDLPIKSNKVITALIEINIEEKREYEQIKKLWTRTK